MNNLRTLTATTGEEWSLDEMDGELFVSYTVDRNELLPRIMMPIDEMTLAVFELAARHRRLLDERQAALPLPAPSGNVIPFRARSAA